MNLRFIGGLTSEIEVTKEGRKYLYFTAKNNMQKYRVVKETGEIQIAPYWNKGAGMYLE